MSSGDSPRGGEAGMDSGVEIVGCGRRTARADDPGRGCLSSGAGAKAGHGGGGTGRTPPGGDRLARRPGSPPFRGRIGPPTLSPATGDWARSRRSSSVGGPAPRLGEPGEPGLAGGVDEDHRVAQVVPARLEEDRGVEPRRAPAAPAGRGDGASKVFRIAGWRIASRSRRADGSAKTIRPRRLAVDLRARLPAGPVTGRRMPRPNRSTTRSCAGRWASRAWPIASASSTQEPSRARPAAARLLPAPMPPTRPITGTGPLAHGPGRRGVCWRWCRGLCREEWAMTVDRVGPTLRGVRRGRAWAVMRADGSSRRDGSKGMGVRGRASRVGRGSFRGGSGRGDGDEGHPRRPARPGLPREGRGPTGSRGGRSVLGVGLGRDDPRASEGPICLYANPRPTATDLRDRSPGFRRPARRPPIRSP